MSREAVRHMAFLAGLLRAATVTEVAVHPLQVGALLEPLPDHPTLLVEDRQEDGVARGAHARVADVLALLRADAERLQHRVLGRLVEGAVGGERAALVRWV